MYEYSVLDVTHTYSTEGTVHMLTGTSTSYQHDVVATRRRVKDV